MTLEDLSKRELYHGPTSLKKVSMRSKNNHHPEHITLPATKMMEKSRIKMHISPTKKKLAKKIHKKRSRRYLKDTIPDFS